MKRDRALGKAAELLRSIPMHGWLPLAACCVCCVFGAATGTLIVAGITVLSALGMRRDRGGRN